MLRDQPTDGLVSAADDGCATAASDGAPPPPVFHLFTALGLFIIAPMMND
jgi:MYXO-CTERM domain-containing protein